jgi:hypothetical protein
MSTEMKDEDVAPQVDTDQILDMMWNASYQEINAINPREF